MTSAPAPTILVAGASGQLGALVVQKLIERGQPAGSIVAGARDTAKLADLAALGVATATVDYEAPATLAAALEGVDTVVLVSSNEVGKRATQHQNVINAAKTAGISKLVYTSLAQADTSTNPLAPEHKATEEALKASGIPFAITRNNWYTENYLGNVAQARETGTLTANAGEGRVASASRADYADGTAVVALSDEFVGQTLEFAGDSAWNYADLATAISEVIGSEVTYNAISAEEHAALLQQFGLDEGTAGFVAALDQAVADGTLEFTDGTLSRITGTATTPLVEGLRG